MGALSGNSVLPLNINNPAILISRVGLRLPPHPQKNNKKNKNEFQNAKEFWWTCHVNVTPGMAPTTHGQAQGPSRKLFQGRTKTRRLFNKIKARGLFCGKAPEGSRP